MFKNIGFKDIGSMAFFAALGLALLTGAYASSFVPMPEPAPVTQPAAQPTLSLSWAPSWLVAALHKVGSDVRARGAE